MAHLDEGTVAGQEMLVHENEYMGRQGDEPSRLTLAGNQNTSAACVKHYIIIIDVSQVDRRLQNVMCKLPCNFVNFRLYLLLSTQQIVIPISTATTLLPIITVIILFSTINS